MKKLFCFLPLVLLFAACDISLSDYIPINPGVPNNAARIFWALNYSDNSYYTLVAQKLAEGNYCTIWVELDGNADPKNVNAAKAQEIARIYDTNIYLKIKDVFSLEDFTYAGFNFKDTMELADAGGDQDGKFCILLLDIKDGFHPVTNRSYLAGYFDSTNFRPSTTHGYSNERDMIYLDTYPLVPGSEAFYKNLAHELQHLMNYVNTQVIRNIRSDVWLDEGLSAAAEWVFLGQPDTDRMDWYNDRSTTISTGNNFFVWDQYEDDDSILDDYATVNLFFQWLRLQSGGTSSIYRTINRSTYSDYNAIVSSMNGYTNWPTLLKSWLAANYINAPSGPYGYMNDPLLRFVKARTAPSGITSIRLFPGEGVYSVTAKTGTVPNPGTYIRYAGLNKNSAAVNDVSTYASGILLTYNINTNPENTREAGRETGMTTGVAASVETLPESLSARTAPLGPYAISAAEMLRRNGHGETIRPLSRLKLGDNYTGDKDN